ncbi:GGDEF domain-containing protein [Devosia sp. PTR5]|uniref:diguanylate cyclase n=1 Tax=Devosia oryzisoli TaxID=2774138 RepID=A0A927FPV1_9HYPH|nr:GGDEF domain-containing protein [Devosia oryzisoli]MBD8064045.1 GGDEF domain-containing protein [Devosia oryzisoli]
MVVDQASLLIAIAFSSASLMLALLIGWLSDRQETYLVQGACGIGLVVVALLVMGLRHGAYDLLYQVIPFSVLLGGFTLIFSASRLFRRRDSGIGLPLAIGVACVVLTDVPLLMGYSGVGTLVLNATSALIMSLCAREFALGRQESRLAMLVNAGLYGLTAVSFAACAAVLLVDQRWVLTAPPDNWAEDINSIMSLVGLTGIGAITLTLHHARSALRHREEANTDPLTGALNRRALFERYPEGQSVSSLAVLMFDLDHFKQINDRLGHAKGDEVLQRFTDLLRQQLRPEDMIARLGGEEFGVILPGLDRDEARAVAERIRTAFADLAITINNAGGVATVSAGLATGGPGESFSSVLSRADAALYKAKRRGRNKVHLAPLKRVA